MRAFVALLFVAAVALAQQHSVHDFPEYVEDCSRSAGKPPGYSMKQLASGEQNPSHEDMCVFQCALSNAGWVDENGRMSDDTMRQLAQSNPRMQQNMQDTQSRINAINNGEMDSCQRSYRIAQVGYSLHNS